MTPIVSLFGFDFTTASILLKRGKKDSLLHNEIKSGSFCRVKLKGTQSTKHAVNDGDQFNMSISVSNVVKGLLLCFLLIRCCCGGCSKSIDPTGHTSCRSELSLRSVQPTNITASFHRNKFQRRNKRSTARPRH